MKNCAKKNKKKYQTEKKKMYNRLKLKKKLKARKAEKRAAAENTAVPVVNQDPSLHPTCVAAVNARWDKFGDINIGQDGNGNEWVFFKRRREDDDDDKRRTTTSSSQSMSQRISPNSNWTATQEEENLKVLAEKNQRTVTEFCTEESLALLADEVGDESYESRTSTSISQEDLEELMTSVKKDPYLKTILEDIETGGPTVLMRYLNDTEITQKLALAMGFGVLGGYSVNSVEHNAPIADAEDQTAKQA